MHKSDFCYKIHNTAKTWQQAQDQCQADGGGTLVQINSQAENEKILEYAINSDIGLDPIWIGFNRTGNQWLWQPEGEPFDYRSWAVNQPNNLYGQDCGSMWVIGDNRGNWNDDECLNKYPFICMSLKKGTTTICSG